MRSYRPGPSQYRSRALMPASPGDGERRRCRRSSRMAAYYQLTPSRPAAARGAVRRQRARASRPKGSSSPGCRHQELKPFSRLKLNRHRPIFSSPLRDPSREEGGLTRLSENVSVERSLPSSSRDSGIMIEGQYLNNMPYSVWTEQQKRKRRRSQAAARRSLFIFSNLCCHP